MSNPKQEFAFVILIGCVIGMVVSLVAAWLLSLPL
jgi:NhaP-type Na+/H+ or K+/H+ antiporter